MPEVHVRVRWPEGRVEELYSPSTVISERLEAGVPYAVHDFVSTATEALRIGSDRVQQKYGFPCGRAAAQITSLAERERTYGPDAVVVVEAFR